MREPHVAADHAVVADAGHAAENRRPGVDDDVVPDVRMALDALDGVAVFVQLEALCAERDALIELHVLADGRRFADDDAGAVVDEKVVADRRAGVDIDTGELVGIFGHHARQHGDAHFVQPVRYPVNADRFKRGIGEHDLVAAHCGGIAVVSGLNVGFQAGLDLRDLFKKTEDDCVGLVLGPFRLKRCENLFEKLCSALQVVAHRDGGGNAAPPGGCAENMRIHGAAQQCNEARDTLLHAGAVFERSVHASGRNEALRDLADRLLMQ